MLIQAHLGSEVLRGIREHTMPASLGHNDE